MKKKTKLQLEALIEEGKSFSFNNNKKKVLNFARTEYYFKSEVTSEFNSWITKTEHFITSNYDETSGPVTNLKEVDKQLFNGTFQETFTKELNKVNGVLQSCKSITPNKKILKRELFDLLTNKLFYSIFIPSCTIVASVSFLMGTNNGKEINYSKDKEISDLQDSIRKIKNKETKNFKSRIEKFINKP